VGRSEENRPGYIEVYQAQGERFAQQGEGEQAHRGSTVAAAPGITTKATSLFIAISTYISHTYTEDKEKERKRWRKLERAKESEGKREEIPFSSLSSPVFFFFVSLSPPIFFPLLPFPVMHLHPARLTPVAM